MFDQIKRRDENEGGESNGTYPLGERGEVTPKWRDQNLSKFKAKWNFARK